MIKKTLPGLAPVALAAILAFATGAKAQDYPTKPIQVIVPFAAGSASDVVTRIMLNKMAGSVGQAFIVENRPGAGGNTGTAIATRATPDGYTLVMSTSGPLAANKTLFKDLGYDPQKDLTPISLFAILPNVIVINSKLPPKNLKEFVEYAKANPKKLNYGSVGVGSSQHLAGAYFEQVTGTQLTHVPYRNIAGYTPDFIAGPLMKGDTLNIESLGFYYLRDGKFAQILGARYKTLPVIASAGQAASNRGDS